MRYPTAPARPPRRGGPSLAVLLVVAFVGACSQSATPASSTVTAAAPAPAAAAPAPAAPGAAASAAAAPAAASPPSATGNGAAVKDICSLLTPAEVGAAVGYSVAPGKLNASGNACRWQGQTSLGAQLVYGTGGEAAFQTMAAFPFSGGSQPISGIGDEAAQSSGTEAVAFRKGDTVIVIDAADATTGAAVVLAKLVASRL